MRSIVSNLVLRWQNRLQNKNKTYNHIEYTAMFKFDEIERNSYKYILCDGFLLVTKTMEIRNAYST